MKQLTLLCLVFLLLSAAAIPASAQRNASRTASARAAYGDAPMGGKYQFTKKKRAPKLRHSAVKQRKTNRQDASARRRATRG